MANLDKCQAAITAAIKANGFAPYRLWAEYEIALLEEVVGIRRRVIRDIYPDTPSETAVWPKTLDGLARKINGAA